MVVKNFEKPDFQPDFQNQIQGFSRYFFEKFQGFTSK
jgi:hypothetical protein